MRKKTPGLREMGEGKLCEGEDIMAVFEACSVVVAELPFDK